MSNQQHQLHQGFDLRVAWVASVGWSRAILLGELLTQRKLQLLFLSRLRNSLLHPSLNISRKPSRDSLAELYLLGKIPLLNQFVNLRFTQVYLCLHLRHAK